MEVVIIAVIILAGLIIKGIYDRIQYEKKLIRKAVNDFGKEPKKDITYARAEAISYYSLHRPESKCHIDDTTWEDTDMPRIYGKLNSCFSAIGEEYLYYLLRNPSDSEEELNERERVISHFMTDEKNRTDLGVKLLKIGSLKNISAYEYINRLRDIETDNSLIHIVQALLLLAAIGTIFINPVYGVLFTIVMFFVNVITYFKRKSLIEGYFTIVFYILRLLEQARELKKTGDSELNAYYDRIITLAGSFDRMKRNSVFIMSGAGAGPLELLFDYIKMAFHIDLIKFNTMLKEFSKHVDEFEGIFETVGYLDCMLAIASYRKLHEGKYTIPVTENGGKAFISAQKLAHPLLIDPVTNDLETEKCILLTGSNASGKSTFLKTVALNAIFAQTIHTVLAESYKASFFRVMSSIALRDDIESGESYYIVEIKSLKRIIDRVAEPEEKIPVLCFIDEVLRGTNTVERIAASTQILKGLGNSSCLCLAATHDIELTQLLECVFDNYHFEEQILDDEIRFDYRLKSGRATSRNAINLLRIMGYSPETVNAAVNMAERYIDTGEWKA